MMETGKGDTDMPADETPSFVLVARTGDDTVPTLYLGLGFRFARITENGDDTASLPCWSTESDARVVADELSLETGLDVEVCRADELGTPVSGLN